MWSNDQCGTLLYNAPEVVLNLEYNQSVDIWSAGIVQYMLFTSGTHPLADKNTVKKMQYMQIL